MANLIWNFTPARKLSTGNLLMISKSLDNIPESLARQLHANHMSLLGIENTMHLAHASNRLTYAARHEWRTALFENEFDALLRDNSELVRPPLTLNDGWVIDDSMTLPFLTEILADSEEIIAERSGKRTTPEGAYRSYFQDMWQRDSDPEKYPSFLNFACSSDLIATVGRYLECIPALSTTLPSGIRFVESNAAFDDQPDTPHDSQLYHIDYYSLPNVYVLVLLQDTGPEHGPWTFLPRSTSQKVKEALGYWGPDRGYRLSDEEVFSVADRGEVIEFTGKRGSVLFIESSGCMHFGSRNSILPRFQLMLGYTGACRTDFTEAFMPPVRYPVNEQDSQLRKMILQNSLLPGSGTV
jgi:hypothetical protein